MRLLLILIMASGVMGGAILVDRIAVVVGKQAIKLSDVERELRVTAFLNRQPLDLSAAARRKTADRLVDQQIIRQELSAQGYSRPTDADAAQFLQQITNERYHGSATQLQSALVRYGLSRDVLRQQLLWQLTVLRFIDQRFRPGIQVTDEEVKTYYDQHLADLRKQYPKDFSFATLSPTIRTSMEGQRIDQEFEAWLEQARKRNRIEYKEAAFQ